MNITKIINRLDKWQRRRASVGFVLAVIKKYSDDQAGYLAVILTYYSFLSIFPLMLVVTTIIKQLLPLNSQLRTKLIAGLSAHIPIIGSELSNNVHGLHHSGVALAVAVVITIYGMRGIANATQHSLNHIWLVPKSKRPTFPNSTLKSLAIVLLGGIGFLASAALTSYIATLGHSSAASLVSALMGFVVLALTIFAVFKIGLAKRQLPEKIMKMTILAALGLEILQLIGGYLVINELKHLTSLYGLFAAVLGLIFWLYLMVQIVVYAVEVGAVRDMKLWPRSLDSSSPTPQDQLAIHGYKQRDGL
jgi:membrane protein